MATYDPNEYSTSVNKTKNTTYNYDPSQSPNVVLKGSVEEYNYSEIYDSAEAESSISETKNITNSYSGIWSMNMGVSHNFTLYVKELNEADTTFNMPSRDGYFLPLKSLDFKPVKLDNLKIKAGVFSDLPFFHRRSMGVLNCVMHDSDKSLISQKLYHWWNACVNTAGYVPYVTDMCRSAEYTEFMHDGKVAVRYGFVVMPDGDISTSRTYDGTEGSLTEYKFQLLIVSNIKIFSGSKGRWVEADWGDGGGPDADYERRVHGIIYNYDNKGGNAIINDPAIADYVGKV